MLIGQLYLTNSFSLGFINVTPMDLLLEVKGCDPDSNEVELKPSPPRGDAGRDSWQHIIRWFESEYPGKTSANCLLKNASAFEQLISQQAAILVEETPDLAKHR